MKTTVFAAASFLASVVLAMSAPASALNLVTNGDFEAGNSGFGSAYTYAPSVNQMSGYPQGVYLIDNNPNDIHDLFASYGDHTSGSGLMMIVNGATTPDMAVWSQSGIGVQANTDYFFSTWIASANPASPAQLAFSINGQAIGTFNATSTTGDWRQFSAVWNSGSNTTADIALVNLNTTAGGNDFTLDDISLSTMMPVPEPTAWLAMILGFGAAGAVLRRQRQATFSQR